MFEELYNKDNNEKLPVLSENNVQWIQEIAPDTPRNLTRTALTEAKNINNAIYSMKSNTFDSNNFNDISNCTNKTTGFLSLPDVVTEFRNQTWKVEKQWAFIRQPQNPCRN